MVNRIQRIDWNARVAQFIIKSSEDIILQVLGKVRLLIG